jgi:hypothetical protein
MQAEPSSRSSSANRGSCRCGGGARRHRPSISEQRIVPLDQIPEALVDALTRNDDKQEDDGVRP